MKVGQKVQVTVLEVDLARRRIGLSMKSKPESAAPRPSSTGPKANNPQPPQVSARAQNAPRPPATDWFTLALNKAAQAKTRRRARDDE